MTSGIYDEGAPGSQLSQLAAQHPDQPISSQKIVAMAVAQGPAGPPGTFVYSDTNYVVLGMIAQAVTHQSIGRLITDRVLRPLHLSQTSYPATSALPSPAATPYAVLPKKTLPFPIYNPTYLASAGAMVSTVPDLARWAQDLGTGALLSKATFAERLGLGPFVGNFVPVPGTAGAALPAHYGLGLFSLGGLIGHNGINNGFTDDVFYLPSRRATIVVAVNGNNSSVSGETVSDAAAVSIADIVLGDSLTTAGGG
jgi:D-alanyl-D-alanine carboxypeptidase